MSVISVSSIISVIPNEKGISSSVNPVPIQPITGIKLISAQSGAFPSIPGFDLVTCIESPSKPVCLRNRFWIAISRDCRKSPITKFSLEDRGDHDLWINASTEDSFRITGKPIYEIYGGAWESFADEKRQGIYHCQTWNQALEIGKIAIVPVSQDFCLVACLDPLYLLSDLETTVKLENLAINPLLSSDGLESVPDIQSFIFPEGPQIRLYLAGGISFSGNVLTDAEGTRYHASHIYYFGKETEGRLYCQGAITVISNFDSPCHDYFHPILLQILSGPRESIEPLITQLFLTRLVPSGLAGIPREPYSEYSLVFDLLPISTMIDLFQALLLEERVIIVGDRVDVL